MISTLRSLDEAIAALETAVGLFLLTVHEDGVASDAAWTALEALGDHLADVQRARELAVELREATGRPCLRLMEGGA